MKTKNEKQKIKVRWKTKLGWEYWEFGKDIVRLCYANKETLGQWIGMKSSDGTEIYEGDVVSVVPIKGSLYIGVVKFHPHTASFVLQAAQDPKAWFSLHDDFAIAIHGNIYDDEDLKKKYWEIYQK